MKEREKQQMTFEDVKRIRENPTAKDCDNKELHKLIDIAIEKQIPKKLKKEIWIFKNKNDMRLATESDVLTKDNHIKINHCPCCDETPTVAEYLSPPRYDLYCRKCGQALDWSDAK